jgi:DNA/RNA endonuclease G (NUC1)
MWNFYIPPNSNQDIWLKLENTFDMALNDNSVDYIMATGNLMKTNWTVQIPKLNLYWHNLV